MARDTSPPVADTDDTPHPEHNVISNPIVSLTQEQIDEVVRIMKANEDKIVVIGVSELEGERFQCNTAEPGRKRWWQNCKMLVLLGLSCVFLVMIIIFIYYLT